MMADVEFEPLHGELEDEEEAEFVQGGRKKDTPGKRHKQKSAQLFPRKSVEKKDRTIVLDNSKAFPASPISTKAGHNQHHHHHHHHQRNVEGLVGPGDIQFGSSPPHYAEEDVMQNSLSQSTGNMPITNSQTKQTQRPLHLPVRPQPPAWSQVSQPVPTKPQQVTPIQEKPTLLEQANFVAGSAQKAPSAKTPDKFDERRSFQAQKSPPRVASPTENRNKSVQIPMVSPTGRKFQRSESWGPSSNPSSIGDHFLREENWADFSKTSDGALSADDGELESQRRRASQVSTISEGSEGSCVSEIDEGVFRITDEQRIYYVTQFKKLQPNDKGLIKGPQARDFFMKSNLPVEVLSKIWQLSDVNKDSALDIEEFCIAMHLVVAVKHEVELPSVLPAMLAPKPPAQGFTASFPATSNGHPEEERPHSPKESALPPDEQSWANFDGDGKPPKHELGGDEPQLQTTGQPLSEELGHSSQSNLPLESSLDKNIQLKTADSDNSNDEKISGNSKAERSHQVLRTLNKDDVKHDTKQHPSVDANGQTPVTKEFIVKKTSIEIARPRGMGPAINLMDSAPGQLLPPPDSRKIRKMAQQARPEPTGPMSPPLSPDPRFSSDFSNNFETIQSNDVVDGSDKKSADSCDEDKGIVGARDINFDVNRESSDQIVDKFDGNDGFEPPKLLPRSSEKSINVGTDEKKEPQNTRNIEVAEVFIRRSSSVRRGERPRSYTADSRSSMESLVDALPNTSAKDLTVPPTPPPRKTKSHKRGSSLDLNKIFGARAQRNMAEIKENADDQTKARNADLLPPRLPKVDAKDDKKEKKERSDFQGIARPRPAPKHHRRSTSHEFTVPLAPLAPPPKTGDGMLKDGLPTGHRKKPAPPRPHTITRNARSKSLERTIEIEKIEKPSVEEKKPRQLRRPLRQKRQKHEIQAEIRLLREKNSAIASLNSELHQELKEVMEMRTHLESQLAKAKQTFD